MLPTAVRPGGDDEQDWVDCGAKPGQDTAKTNKIVVSKGEMIRAGKKG